MLLLLLWIINTTFLIPSILTKRKTLIGLVIKGYRPKVLNLNPDDIYYRDGFCYYLTRFEEKPKLKLGDEVTLKVELIKW